MMPTNYRYLRVRKFALGCYKNAMKIRKITVFFIIASYISEVSIIEVSI